MDAGVRHQAFLLRKIEEGPMSDPRLLGHGAWVRGPCVQMGIEMDDGYGAINLVERPQDG